jgi:hypothetical protein
MQHSTARQYIKLSINRCIDLSISGYAIYCRILFYESHYNLTSFGHIATKFPGKLSVHRTLTKGPSLNTPYTLESLSECSNEPNVLLVLLIKLEYFSGPPNYSRDPFWYYPLIGGYILITCHIVLKTNLGSLWRSCMSRSHGFPSFPAVQNIYSAINELVQCFFKQYMKLCHY